MNGAWTASGNEMCEVGVLIYAVSDQVRQGHASCVRVETTPFTGRRDGSTTTSHKSSYAERIHSCNKYTSNLFKPLVYPADAEVGLVVVGCTCGVCGFFWHASSVFPSTGLREDGYLMISRVSSNSSCRSGSRSKEYIMRVASGCLRFLLLELRLVHTSSPRDGRGPVEKASDTSPSFFYSATPRVWARQSLSR